MIDGFRRLWAGRRIEEIRELSTRLIEVDERQAEAAARIAGRAGPWVTHSDLRASAPLLSGR